MAYPNPLPSSGTLSMGDIVSWMYAAGEITSTANQTLTGLKAASHLTVKSLPARISDFYGYGILQAVGVLVVDVLTDLAGLNLVGYMSTPGLNYSGVAAYTGNNFIPNAETAASDCYVLAADKQTGGAIWRFEFNIAKFVNENPGQTTLEFPIRGCASSAGSINMSYSLKGTSGQSMTMTGSPGTYQPNVTGSGNISTVNINGVSVPSGANGTYNNSIGVVLKTFVYTLSNHAITVI